MYFCAGSSLQVAIKGSKLKISMFAQLPRSNGTQLENTANLGRPFLDVKNIGAVTSYSTKNMNSKNKL
jgi:hypothetical protein